MQDSRIFRMPFDVYVSLYQDGWHTSASLSDLSLHGLLIQQPPNWPTERNAHPFQAVVELSVIDQIRMDVTLAFSRNGALGFQCQHIDLDSITQLQRMITTYLGDAALAQRKLAELHQ